MSSLTSVTKPDSEAAAAPPEVVRQVLGSASPPGQVHDAPSGDQRRLVSGLAKPMRQGPAGLLSVIGQDERTKIVTTDLAPYAVICALEITAPWGVFIGTGWFIGPRTLITAGHCVYHRTQMGGWAQSIKITPGANGNQAPFPSFTATRFSTTETWLNDLDPDYDMAAIHLEADSLPPGLAPFRVAALPDDQLLSQSVNVSGYPADKGGLEQWWARNRIRAVRPLRIFYDVDTMGGQSGAPAFILPAANAAPMVVGIHAYGTGGTPSDLPMEVNSAPRITNPVLEVLHRWVEQDSPGFAILS